MSFVSILTYNKGDKNRKMVLFHIFCYEEQNIGMQEHPRGSAFSEVVVLSTRWGIYNSMS